MLNRRHDVILGEVRGELCDTFLYSGFGVTSPVVWKANAYQGLEGDLKCRSRFLIIFPAVLRPVWSLLESRLHYRAVMRRLDHLGKGFVVDGREVQCQGRRDNSVTLIFDGVPYLGERGILFRCEQWMEMIILSLVVVQIKRIPA